MPFLLALLDFTRTKFTIKLEYMYHDILYIIQEFESITAITQASQCPGSCDCFDATEKRLIWI